MPISSSGHLVLGHALMDGDFDSIRWHSADVVIDVAVHLGTLLSVLLYFRHDLMDMWNGTVSYASQRNKTQGGRLALYVVIASIPVILAGLCLHLLSPDWVRSIPVVAWATLIFGVLLGAADKFCAIDKKLENMRISSALIIGLSQVLALIPGTSRSGITMTAARFCGFNREDSARFSLLLAIIAISGAGVIAMGDLLRSGDLQLGLNALLAVLTAFISGWVAITLMMKWLRRATFMPFVIYRVLLGGGLLVWLYWPW